ncbi:MAG: HAMP domain-containing protein [Candidatus Zixiibacteriota bacterium]|nr:MAG: HAMP domain-containing protein [candidate division Zixibacteria bacterium]
MEIDKKNYTAEDIESRARRALIERPSFSIRSRLLLGFLLLFVLSAGAEITSIITLGKLQNKTQFLGVADKYTNEIQQARRFEKNFFLYSTDLQFVFDHVTTAESLMTSSEGELKAVLGEDNLQTLKLHLEKYIELLHDLRAVDAAEISSPQNQMIENELRRHGSEMISFALELSEKELKTVKSMFKWVKIIPLLFLLVLLILAIYMANFLNRQINRPLSRLMKLTRRISVGDLTPIMPARKYRDEFTNMNLALNHMMYELNRRQEQMIESHKLRAIGTLTAGIAHELNNPLNNITLTAFMLEEDYDNLSDKERLEMVRDLIKEADRSKNIVRNLLDFARESEIDTEHLNIEELVSETIKLAQNRIRLKGVKVDAAFPDNMPLIHGDRQQLVQVFLNLILNAVDAMSKGGLLKISSPHSDLPDFITVKFEDNGCGIPHHMLSSIFDPFFTTKSTGHGTGLGLSVTQGIIEKHGGDINVESEVGVGTTFSVSFPVAKIPASLEK